jgi:hypothetical protein
MVLPMAGAIAGAVDRRLYGWFGRAFMRCVGAWFELFLAPLRGLHENSAEWNDYLMAYWMMTGDADAVEELFCRATQPAKGLDFVKIKEAAQTMVSEARGSSAEFDRAWRQVENEYASAAAVEKALA